MDSCWVLKEGEAVFLKAVSPGRLTVRQRMASHSEYLGSIKWSPGVKTKKEDMKSEEWWCVLQ